MVGLLFDPIRRLAKGSFWETSSDREMEKDGPSITKKAATGFGPRRPGIGSLSRRAGAERPKAIGSNNYWGNMGLKMKKSDRFDGFTVNVFLDDDGDYLAHFFELPNVSAFGESPEEALAELATAWEGVKESCKKHREKVLLAPARKRYSGQFNVRIDRRLHRALAIEAAKAGISLNAIVSQKLAKSVSV
jgi:predicted HicB family RNase H-like nuclease